MGDDSKMRESRDAGDLVGLVFHGLFRVRHGVMGRLGFSS